LFLGKVGSICSTQALFAKSLERVPDHSLAVGLLELKSFYSAPRVRPACRRASGSRSLKSSIEHIVRTRQPGALIYGCSRFNVCVCVCCSFTESEGSSYRLPDAALGELKNYDYDEPNVVYI